jgi:hypothetical protein
MIEGQYYHLVTFAAGVLVLPFLYVLYLAYKSFFYVTCDQCKKDVYLCGPHVYKVNTNSKHAYWHMECINVMTRAEMAECREGIVKDITARAAQQTKKEGFAGQLVDTNLTNLRNAIRDGSVELKVVSLTRAFIRTHNKDLGADIINCLCREVFDPLHREFNSADNRQDQIRKAERVAWSEMLELNKK